MEIYLVGGAVRDQLLGLSVDEKDWVVVGATPQQLLDDGFQQVGKDFPVFLHPESNEEYALARKERKVAAGYTGFEFEFDPTVSLEEDLLRRDLTINAIAQNSQGQLIDPYGGLADLKARRLRHVSKAFVEDPLRVLRVARFQARLHHLGFTIDPNTFRLMKTLSAGDELLALAPERVWRELEKGLTAKSPSTFIKTLYRCGALNKLLPELHSIYHHTDNFRDAQETVGKRIEMALDYLAGNFQQPARTNKGTTGPRSEIQLRSQAAWAICCHALEQTSTPKNLIARTLPKHDPQKSVVTQLNQRLNCPKEHQRLALLAANYIHIVIQADSINVNTLVDLLEHCDAWRRPDQFTQLLFIAECLTSTNTENPQRNLGSIALLRQAHQNCMEITAEQFIQRGLEGAAIGEAMRNARKVAVGELKQQFKGG